ncbi:MAG: hypothetical protein H6Q04_2485 [Acidobacteria bacterium]|jgi:hypothetical protein|nr:hypothetical protein [Acidobacteriota bacterium]
MAKFFSKDEKFFKIFCEMSGHILEAAKILDTMFRDPEADLVELLAKINDLEHKGDELTHRVIDELNKTFITPIDREDLHDLSKALDDVLDMINVTADRLVLFRIKMPINEVKEMSGILLNQVKEISAAIFSLQDDEKVVNRCIEINRLENDADRLFQVAIGRLFEEEKDAIEVIKRKEIIDHIEIATDKAEDVANVLETIIVKNA